MERQYIRDHYPHEPTKIVANDLNRSIASVYGHAKASGIAKSESFMESALSGRRNFSRLNTKKTQFKKGHIPANKGMKMPAHVYEKVKKSFFRKVQLPWNTKSDGYERVSKEGYREVRIGGVFKSKHRVIWESVRGPIPDKMVIVLKDGNPLNCTCENLECISRTELMARNTFGRFPPELKKTIRTFNKLKKTINEKQN